MSDAIELRGLDGATPLGFMAAVGLLNVVTASSRSLNMPAPLLAWIYRGAWNAALTCERGITSVVEAVMNDLKRPSIKRVLELSYPKLENDNKNKSKIVKSFSGLRPPVGVLRAWLDDCMQRSDWEALSFLSSLMIETASESIKPENCPTLVHVGLAVDGTRADALTQSAAQTVFDFTSKNQQFLDQARIIATTFNSDEAMAELFGESGGVLTDRTMGWDPREDRPGALFSQAASRRYPVLEWLAFRALPLFPLAGAGELAITTSCRGRRKKGQFRWCVWSGNATLQALRSLNRTIYSATQSSQCRQALGIAEVFESELGKGADGYSGVFRPVSVV